NLNGDLRLIVADLGSGAKCDLSFGPGLHEGMQWTLDGRGVLCVFNGPSHTADLWLADLDGIARRQLTQSMPEDLAGYPFVTPTHVRYLSLDGCTQVPALLFQPRDVAADSGPAVIHIHGGPAWQRMNSWYPEIQWLLARGCTVLSPN